MTTEKKKTTSGRVFTDNIHELRASVENNLRYLYDGKATANLESDIPDEWTMTVPVFMPREALEERLADDTPPDNNKLH